MEAGDLPAAMELWSGTPHVEMAEGDQPDQLQSYLRRNPGLSQVAMGGGALVGALLVGHDGRRGLLYHLAVAEGWRGGGIGRGLVERGISALGAAGIERALILVDRANEAGAGFWGSSGWETLGSAVPMAVDIKPKGPAGARE